MYNASLFRPGQMRQFIVLTTSHIVKYECFILLTKYPSIISQIESLHSRDPLTNTSIYVDIVHWANWNRLKMRNMKLSIFDQSVYIRSLKLNGSTFNAYFKRFDRCETTSMWGMKLSVTESRWYNVWFIYRKHEALFFRSLFLFLSK